MKQKKITLTKDEEIIFDDLTEREKQIYGSGMKEGKEDAGNAVLFLLAIFIIIFVLAYGFITHWKFDN